MNSTPKQQDGDDGGVAPASGARPSLEQTVLGVAPAPNAAVPNAAVPNAAVPNAAVPSLGAAPSSQPALPPPLDVTAAPPPTVSFAAAAPPAPGATPAALIAAPVIVVAGSGSASPGSSDSGSATPEQRVSRESLSAPAPPPSLEGPVTAPIPLVHVMVPVEVAAPPRPAPRTPTTGAVDTTLPVGGVARPTVAAAVAPQEPAAEASVQRTALSEDYLREARQAALDAVARSSAPPMADAVSIGATAPSRTDMDAAPPSFQTRPSIVATPLPREGDPSSTHDSVAIKSSRGFEPVPVLRAPLAESLSGGLGPVAEVGGHRNGGPPSSARSRAALPAQRSGDSVLRWLLLAAVALVSVASVMVGQRVWQRYREPSSPQLAAVVAPGELEGVSSGAASTSRALMPSRPAVEAAPAGRAVVVSVTGGRPEDTAGPAGAGPEAQVAATAGRHVIAGNYADALPLYQQLERAYPDNSAYVAMSRLLETKVGTSNDTRTVTPAPSKPVTK
jgi:hypothetical protein